MVKKNQVIIITGPTAIGKTKLAIKIAQEFNGEIINADSVSIYKHFNIGSAKPSKEEQKGIKHHLLDLIEPNEDFDVKKFQMLVNQLIKQIHQKNKVPIIVGGTTFYIQALIDNYDLPEVKRDLEFFKKCQKFSTKELYLKLSKVDPKSLAKIAPNNRRRIIRALEINNFGIKKSQISKTKWKYDPLIILLKAKDKEKYNQKIILRIQEMIDLGLVDEVKTLLQKYPDSKPINAIGYKEIVFYLKNQKTYSLQNALDELAKNTRNLAKKQLTWMRNKINGQWYFENEEFKIINDIKNYLK